MPIVNPERWAKAQEGNQDQYGKACIAVAGEVMRLLDSGQDFQGDDWTAHDIVKMASHTKSEGGITGFMAAMIASMVSELHSRGDEFRRKWNADWGCDEEKAKGRVVNPAILNVEA